jgi:VCBS repeat-containing protein
VYTADNSQTVIQALKVGEFLTDTFTVLNADGVTSTTVTITINGTDDVPTLVADTGSVTEDTAVTVDGNLTTSGTLDAGTGGDAGEDKFTADSFTGDYGSLTLDANGNWVYTADNSQTVIQALKVGEFLTDTFTVLNADGVTSTTVTITINGAADAPEFRSGIDQKGDAANVDAYNFGNINEGTTAGTVIGTVIADDVDTGDTLTYSFEGGALTNGVFTINASTGVITLNKDIDDADLGTYNFNVIVTDSSGLFDVAAVTLNVNNVNDTPVISSTTNTRVSEEGLTGGVADTVGNTDTTNLVTASGTLNISDADGDALTVSLSGPTGITSGGNNVLWSWDGTNTLTGYIGTPGTSSYVAVMTIVLTAPIGSSSGAWTYNVTLLAPVDHSDTSSEDNLSLTLGVNVSDGNGGITNGNFTVVIEDDAPVASVSNLLATNVANEYIGSLTVAGADKDYSADLTGNVTGWNNSVGSEVYFADSGLTTGGETIYYYVDPDHPEIMYAYTDSSSVAGGFSSLNANQDLVFTLKVDPNTGKYFLDLEDSITSIVTSDVDLTGNIPGGNSTELSIYIDGVVEYGSATTTSILCSVTGSSNGTVATINNSNNGIGVGSGKDIGAGDKLILTFQQDVTNNIHIVLSKNSGATYDGIATFSVQGKDASGALLNFTFVGTSVAFEAYLANSAFVEIDVLTLSTASGGGDFNLKTISTESVTIDSSGTTLDFTVDILDSDGDVDSGNSFNVVLGVPSALLALTTNAVALLNEVTLLSDAPDDDTEILLFKAGDTEINNFSFAADTSQIQVDGIRQPMDWRVENGVLIGSMNGRGDLIKLTLDWDAIAAGQQGSVIVNAELLGNLPHNIDVNSLVVTGINVVGTDAAGNTANSTVTVYIEDHNFAPEFISDADTTSDGSIINDDIYDFGAINGEATAGTEVGTVYAIDLNDTDTISYSFEDGSLINGVFSINATTGVITLNQDIGATNVGTFNFNVLVTDIAGLSDIAAVTVKLNNVDAVDDLPGSSYSVTTGSNTAWTIPQSNGENLMTISARNADGSMGVINIESGSNKLGVAGSPRTSDQVAGQIEYNSTTGTSESVVIDFNGLVNKAEFSVSNLFSDENNGEQGIWKAYYNGQLVASDTFKTDAGNLGTFNIDTGSIVFDQLVFEATQTINEATNGSVLSDSSDYFLTAITASGPAIMGTYIVSEDGVLSITDASLGLLNNDSDVPDDTFTLTGLNGATVTDGQVVILPSGALLTIHSDGTYSYDTNGSFEALTAGQLATDTFTYTVTDQYGATDTAIVTINIIGEADASSTYVSYTGNPNADTIQGTDNNDIIVSDQQSIKIVDGESYNIAFIVDTSGSVGRAQLDTMKAQLTSVFNTLKASIGATHSGVVNILLVDFDTGLQASVPVNLANTDALTLLAAALNAMTSGGNTNYAAGFDAATSWFNSLSGGENLTYFITDGYPNTNSSSAPAAFANLNAISNIEAIGIGNGINYNTLRYYDSDGTPVTGVNANNLASVILGTETQLLQGADIVDGAAGNDIIFGDLAQFAGITEQGYLALQNYVADKTGQNVADVDVRAVHDYISAHVNEFNINNQYDGNDILNGAAGNDIIFGQGGNDLIYGGEGNDVLIGGLGDDTLIGGLGNDTFVWSKGDTGTDTIKDFEVNNDTLHLSDLLQNEQNGDLESYLEFSFSNGSTTISIDADLNGSVDQLIVLDGVDLSHEYGSNDEGVIINGLLNDGALIVDSATANPAPSPGTTHADLFDQHNGNIIP